MESNDIPLLISVLLNLLLGLYFIGNVIKPPTKRIKNEKAVMFIAPIIIGGLFGFLGNIFATSMLDIAKPISPSSAGLIFIVSAFAFIGVLWKLIIFYNEAMGE